MRILSPLACKRPFDSIRSVVSSLVSPSSACYLPLSPSNWREGKRAIVSESGYLLIILFPMTLAPWPSSRDFFFFSFFALKCAAVHHVHVHAGLSCPISSPSFLPPPPANSLQALTVSSFTTEES
ncbi:hypothetical protein TRV_05714 [Trichophyton verrucosum HKI 0517]|uniref:Uncharacterized protein n=1 Tax=Trichophyton verrucosum (strain HKI 0517) TaxID=663202 RepID=D4DEX3_TRIVH|nr:uncharacterized protein TRV_05714 [Trichophyton verrucosum HKI 0517]EFE39591.1 hypothetical protein TRV_05714 [Trichophyton verrucosum HKI 0517]